MRMIKQKTVYLSQYKDTNAFSNVFDAQPEELK